MKTANYVSSDFTQKIEPNMLVQCKAEKPNPLKSDNVTKRGQVPTSNKPTYQRHIVKINQSFLT